MDLMDYNSLLKRAMKNIPKNVFEHSRFTIPSVVTHIEGRNTIVINFKEISDRLRRKPEYILKYLLGELATRGYYNQKLGSASFKGRFQNNSLNNLLKKFTEKFIRCANCRRPDTHIVREGRFSYLVCEACGSKRSIPSP
ncbi:MAG: translation initiation factor IF-2 subunit beta [Candidatus Helarchaeota archaeon]